MVGVILVLGLPGSGKGTQGALLAQRAGLPLVSIGDILRVEITERSEMGLRVEGYVTRGRSLPTSLLLVLLGRTMDRLGSDGFIGDGLVRTVSQARGVDTLLMGRQHRIRSVVLLELPAAVAAERLRGRLVCPLCRRVYSETNWPPGQAGKCKCDASALVKREDDLPAMVALRIRRQRRQLRAIIEYYHGSDRLRVVDGQGEAAEVAERVWCSVNVTEHPNAATSEHLKSGHFG